MGYIHRTREKKLSVSDIVQDADNQLVVVTDLYEQAVEEELVAREMYMDKFSSYFLSLLRGSEVEVGKKVPPSVCEKAARALCSDEYIAYENACRESKK